MSHKFDIRNIDLLNDPVGNSDVRGWIATCQTDKLTGIGLLISPPERVGA